jgi:nucleoside phosphorylase
MSDPALYNVGWICALSTELVAAREFLDDEHDPPEFISQHDNNTYILGRMGKHQVVIAALPDAEYGTNAAANVARDMLHSFPNVRIGLMVGIGGGAPSTRNDIRMGDIVVSSASGNHGGVFQYDFGKTIQEQNFVQTGILNRPPTLLRTAVTTIKTIHKADGHQIHATVDATISCKPRLKREFSRPAEEDDRLYRAEFLHQLGEGSCETLCGSDAVNMVSRPTRGEEEDNPTIHYGLIASANQLMKDANVRDTISERNNVLCFEMEAAGLMNHFPCLVIRGICDYADSHKSKRWQGYAAMVAAAYAKELLARVAPTQVEHEKKLSEYLYAGQLT